MIRNRAMTRAELDVVLDWAAAEGWNPGLDDADAFWAADPGGFFVAEEDGVPVAAISVVVHDERFAFLGLYLCCPTHRGRGIGLALWRHALAHAGDRTVGLDGVPEQQANYEMSGFRRAGETVRHVGRIAAHRPAGLRAAEADDLAPLVALEARASGWRKPDYMTAWFAGARSRETLVLEQNGALVGAVTVRGCREGAKVGPLIAPDTPTAVSLTCAAASITDGALSIDVPQAAAYGVALRAEGFEPVFRTARMYKGTNVGAGPGTPILHAVATLELG